MHDRTALGPADVTDEQLGVMVAKLFGEQPDDVNLTSSRADVVDYALPAITTAGRYWVRGDAEVGGSPRRFVLFVKHVQSWGRSPLFAEVPPEIAEMAEAGVPWRTEPLAYRSDLARRLPEGFTMPRTLGVFDLDEKSASIWLEEVVVEPVIWDHARFARAAYLLGRLAASPSVRELAHVGQFEWTVFTYLFGRLEHEVLPALRDESIWSHPLVSTAFEDDLRQRLVEAADAAPAYVEELAALPTATGHGDACPNNLLVRPAVQDFVLIDYGFWAELPIGFDLSQLMVGDIQVGRRTADDLEELEEVILPAYVEGLRAEGNDVPESVVRRAHALQLLIFTGLSTLPVEHLDAPLTPELLHVSAQRAAIARFSLDLVESTAQVSSRPG